MPAVTDRWVRAALGWTGGSNDLVYTDVATDSRELSAGGLFVALRGERWDGHAFLGAARDAGALGAVVRTGTPESGGLTLYHVADPLAAYGQLARARRREVGGPVVAVTGSNGKTSAKELLAAALRTRYRTHATPLNLNNLVGIPQTILAAPPDCEALVIEVGASEPGEVARGREIVEPSVAVITNVAAAHLEGFGSLEGIMAEKVTLCRGVGLAVVGLEPPDLARRARDAGGGAGRVITAGLGPADTTPERVEMNTRGYPILTVGGRRIALPLLGRHQASNAMLAWAVAREVGLDLDAVAAALAGVTLPGGRGELVQAGGLTILNDCYNANPMSFESVMETAEQLRPGRRLVFVAGTMRELGPEAPALHRAVAERLVQLAPDLLVAVGEFVPALEPWAGELGTRLLTAPDALSLGPRLAARLRGDELVVLKASRGVALERILPAIAGRSAPSVEA